MRLLLLGLALLLALPVAAQRPALTLDGSITEARWQLLGTSAGGPAPGFGAGHEINAVYAHLSADATELNIAVAGNVQDGNRILVFLDTRAGGYTNGDFGRTGAPAGIANFNSGTTFDPGFAPDYCLVIGTNAGSMNYFVDLYTLAGTAGGGGGSNLYIGDAADADVGAAPANSSTTQGFEIRLSASPDGTGADLALSRSTVQLFAAYTADNGFLSNQFISPAGSGDVNYGFGPASFDGSAPNPLVLATADPADASAYRLLSSPTADQTVDGLARLNLVQGIDAGAATGAQYPSATSNLYTGYTGSEYTFPSATDDVLDAGRGFWWYLYNQDIAPDAGAFGGGSSQSYALADFRLEAAGPAHTVTQTRAFAETSNGFYMIGNPFAYPFALTSLSADLTFGTNLQVWTGSTYDIADRTSPTAFAAPWQGYFAEIQVAGAPTFTFDAAGISPDATPAFSGRAAATPGVRFVLDGTLASGAAVTDRAARVNLSATATAGWDPEDASKLTPLLDAYALVAPVGTADGAARRAAVLSLDDAPEVRTVPLAFTATQAGTFTLGWTAEALDGWRAELRDLATGAVVDLADATSYAFASEAAAWAERFVLVLTPSGIVAAEADAPAAGALRLDAPRPNPVRAAAEVSVHLDAAQPLRVTLLDALGREVRSVFDGPAAEGALGLSVDVRGLAPGVYVLRAAGATAVETRALTVVR